MILKLCLINYQERKIWKKLIPVIVTKGIFMAVDYFGYLGIVKGIN